MLTVRVRFLQLSVEIGMINRRMVPPCVCEGLYFRLEDLLFRGRSDQASKVVPQKMTQAKMRKVLVQKEEL